jgi:hypothetical protein
MWSAHASVLPSQGEMSMSFQHMCKPQHNHCTQKDALPGVACGSAIQDIHQQHHHLMPPLWSVNMHACYALSLGCQPLHPLTAASCIPPTPPPLFPNTTHRWHASSNGTLPCTWPDGTPWYSDPLGPLFVAGIPKDKQEELEEVRLKVGVSRFFWGGECAAFGALHSQREAGGA